MAEKTVLLVQEEESKKKKFFRSGFVRGIKSECRKITWVSKEKLMMYTKVVVSSTFLFGLGIYATDLCVRTTLKGFMAILHKIMG